MRGQPDSGETHTLGHLRGQTDQRDYYHQLFQVTTKEGEIWYLDITGSQYGFEEVLVPRHMYMAGKGQVGSTAEKATSTAKSAVAALLTQTLITVHLF